MPGNRLLHFARHWFPASIVSSVFEPLLADWQRQWNDATPAQRRLINAKGLAAFVATTVMMTPRLVLASDAFRARPLVLAASFWFVGSILVTLPFLKNGVPLNSLWQLLPASLTFMLPFGILPAIDAMRGRSEGPTVADRRGALLLVVVAAGGVVIGQGWVTPAANQYFRNDMAAEINRQPTVGGGRSVGEVTTSELIAGNVANTTLNGVRRGRELSNRLMLALLPAVLGWLRWRSLSGARKQSWPVVRSCLLAVGATAAFLAAMPAGPLLERIFLAPGFGPLLALGLFAVTARAGIWLRQRASQSPDRSTDHAITSS